MKLKIKTKNKVYQVIAKFILPPFFIGIKKRHYTYSHSDAVICNLFFFKVELITTKRYRDIKGSSRDMMELIDTKHKYNHNKEKEEK